MSEIRKNAIVHGEFPATRKMQSILQVIRARGFIARGSALAFFFFQKNYILLPFRIFSMKKWVLFALLFLVACAPVAEEQKEAPEVPEVIEEPPRPPHKVIEERVVVQCWDNSTASTVEQCPPKPGETKPEPEPEDPRPIGRQLLEGAQEQFRRHAYLVEDKLVIVAGNRSRHYFLRMHEVDDQPITDVYVNAENRSAIAYCDIEREADMQESFDYERSKCRDHVNQPFPLKYEEWVPKGPMHYLELFADKEPMLVENNVQTVNIGGNSKTIQPSIHYEVDGKRLILRIDKRYKVPVKIEREGERAIDFRDTYFDTMVIEDSPVKITADWMEYAPASDYWKE